MFNALIHWWHRLCHRDLHNEMCSHHRCAGRKEIKP